MLKSATIASTSAARYRARRIKFRVVATNASRSFVSRADFSSLETTGLLRAVRCIVLSECRKKPLSWRATTSSLPSSQHSSKQGSERFELLIGYPDSRQFAELFGPVFEMFDQSSLSIYPSGTNLLSALKSFRTYPDLKFTTDSSISGSSACRDRADFRNSGGCLAFKSRLFSVTVALKSTSAEPQNRTLKLPFVLCQPPCRIALTGFVHFGPHAQNFQNFLAGFLQVANNQHEHGSPRHRSRARSWNPW